jgi:hypothetical protein
MRCRKRRSRVVDHLVGAREVLHLGGSKIGVQRELGRSFDEMFTGSVPSRFFSTKSAPWADQYVATIGIGRLNS